MADEKSAHVVVRIESRPGGGYPVVTGVGIYGEGWQGLTLRHRPGVAWADVLSVRAESYQLATERAVASLRGYAGTRWMAEWIDEGRPGASS